MTLRIGTKVSGATREISINGAVYKIEPNTHRGIIGCAQDGWAYTLPNGQTFTHPDKFGALLMCLKDAGGGEWAP